MKNFLFFSLLLVASTTANAQIQKGAVLLGGQVYYSRYDNSNTASASNPVSKSGSLSVSAGKAFKENAVWGLNLSYSPSNNSIPYNAATGGAIIYVPRKEKRYSAGVFYRRYKQLFKNAYFFANGSLSYVGFRQTEVSPTSFKSTYTESGGQLNLTPGVSYNLFKKLQVEILIPSIFYAGYNHTSNNQNQFSIGSGLPNTTLGSLGVGFHFIF